MFGLSLFDILRIAWKTENKKIKISDTSFSSYSSYSPYFLFIYVFCATIFPLWWSKSWRTMVYILWPMIHTLSDQYCIICKQYYRRSYVMHSRAGMERKRKIISILTDMLENYGERGIFDLSYEAPSFLHFSVTIPDLKAA